MKITPEAVAIFCRARAISRIGITGARRKEYFSLCTELHRALGRKQWDADVLLSSAGDNQVTAIYLLLQDAASRAVRRPAAG